MSASPAEEPSIFLNGIDATTGKYFGGPVRLEEIGRAVLGEQTEAELKSALKVRAKAATMHFAVRAEVDPRKLAEAGWGVVFAHNCPPEIVDKLRPLLELRRSQAGDRYKEYRGADGYRPNDNALAWLARAPRNMGPGQANPLKVPYYLLLVGGPDQIPFSFQYRLDVDYSIGRLAFETADQYAGYAESVCEQEKTPPLAAGKAVFFGAANQGDGPTNQSATDLVEPLAATAQKWGAAWSADSLLAAKATKQRLSELLHAAQPPQILFSATHGAAFPCGHDRQLADQGALVCQDWKGPFSHQGPLPPDLYFSAADLDASANVSGMIHFLFACYGGGTPQRDYFPEQAKVALAQQAPRDFMAALPAAMLCHARGSAKAVIAHVERAWTYSFSWPQAGPQIDAYEDALKLLASGAPIGFALEGFGQRYASLSTDVSGLLNLVRTDPTFQPDPAQIAFLWTACNDARSFVILGDPAVRCGVGQASP